MKFLYLLLLGLIGVLSTSLTVVFAATDLQILSHSSFIDSSGIFNIVGQVQNNSSNIIEFPMIHAILYDSNGQVVATGSALTPSQSMDSGEKSPFTIIIERASIPLDQIGNYSLESQNNQIKITSEFKMNT